MRAGCRSGDFGRAAALGLAVAALVAGPAGTSDFVPDDTASWSVPSADLYGVDASGDLVWAVGYWGTVLRSTDAGRTWAYQPTPSDATLHAVSFADAERGWAVGNQGALLRSSDGGASWQAVRVELVDEFGDAYPLESALFDVAAVSATEAWVVGDFGVVLHTRDGASWERLRIPEEVFGDDNLPDRIFNAVEFTDAENGWIAGEFGTTLRTSDGGATWVGERSFEGAVSDVYLMDLAVGGEGLALAGGVGGVVIRSADGGASWQSVRVPTTAGLFGLALGGRRALVVGDRGVLFLSRDAGENWLEPRRPRVFNWLRAAVWTPDGRAYAVGEDGLVLRSADGGESFEVAAGREPPPMEGISVPTPARSTEPGREGDDPARPHP